MAPWWWADLGLIVLAYLLGSIPSGYLAGQWLKGIDIRQQGSGSTGATNVLRTLGKGPALAVFAVDLSKGLGAVLLAQWLGAIYPLGDQDWLGVGVAVAALLGHSKSVWLGFTGGKSVATGLGVLLGMNWLVGLAALGVFSLCLGVVRIVSLSSIIATLAVGVLMVLFHQPQAYQWFAWVAGAYVIWRHRANISRLLAGTEPRLGGKVAPP